jgi:hypothetical protein
MPSAKTSSSKQSSASPRSRHPSNWTTRHDTFVREDAEDNATVRCASVVKRMTGANAAECYHLSDGTQESITYTVRHTCRGQFPQRRHNPPTISNQRSMMEIQSGLKSAVSLVTFPRGERGAGGIRLRGQLLVVAG